MEIRLKKINFEKIYKKDRIKRYTMLLIGILLVSISFNLFCRPNNLVSGGVSGLSIIMEDKFYINPSIFILISNIILIIFSFFLLGKKKTLHSVLGAILFPTFIALTYKITKNINIENQLLLSTLFAGILNGTGSGLVYKAGYSSGGTDIINQIISKYFKISIGNAIYFTDGSIILLSGFVFGINKVMYSIILIYLISYMTDKVIIGISLSKSFHIVTKYPKEIEKYIIEELNHSVTEFYSDDKDKQNAVLMTVLPTKEYYTFKKNILKIDKNAFFVVTDAYEVEGGE